MQIIPICNCIIFFWNFECATIGKICVTNCVFLKFQLVFSSVTATIWKCSYSMKHMLPKRTIVTLNKCSIGVVIVLLSSNTFLDVKEHISCVPFDQTVVTSAIVTLKGCVTMRPSNTFIELQ